MDGPINTNKVGTSKRAVFIEPSMYDMYFVRYFDALRHLGISR